MDKTIFPTDRGENFITKNKGNNCPYHKQCLPPSIPFPEYKGQLFDNGIIFRCDNFKRPGYNKVLIK